MDAENGARGLVPQGDEMFEVAYQLRDLATRKIEEHTAGPFSARESAEKALSGLCGQDWRGVTFVGGKVRAVTQGNRPADGEG